MRRSQNTLKVGRSVLTDYRVRQREYLLKISRALTAQLDLLSVLRLILEAAGEMLSGHAGLIVLREDKDAPATGEGAYTVRASFGIPPQLLNLFTPLWSNGVNRSSGLTRRQLTQIALAADMPLRQVVALPMHSGDQTVGLIYIFRNSGGAFDANDRQVLQSFADQAAIAVNNAQLYQQVAQEKHRLDAILEASADGVMILDPSFRITRFNQALARISGTSAAQAIGRQHDEVISLRNKRAGLTLSEAAAGGWPLVTPSSAGLLTSGPLYLEGDLQRADGSRISVGITYAPLFDREGRLVNLIANVRDITRFREADELKNTFISIISHELKTPVALIKGYAGTLRREDAQWAPQTVRESATIIEEEADRLTQLIDNLLDASRLQAGGLKLNRNDVALDALAARQIELFRTQTSRHQLVCEFPTPFPHVPADPARIEQVLNNLIGNAIKYSPGGGTIRVSGRVRPAGIEVTVSDEGIGIPLEEQARIFERFYRTDDVLSRRTQGSGLGLYIAKAILEAHGGRIWINSASGRGTAVSFLLPKD
ncbi:MAG TPA: ATP-binding protein [Anaerolineae bacterium]|nr:ATP-binding protein [Anaerolineae bacterium]